MSGLMEKAKDLVSSSEPTSADMKEEEIPNYGSGNIVPASDGFYDAGPGAPGGATTAPKVGSTHKGDNYDMKNVKGGDVEPEALEGTSTGAGSVGGSTAGVANEGRSEKESYSSGETGSSETGGSAGSGSDVFANDPTSASSGGVDLSSSSGGDSSAEGVSSGAGDGTLRGALRGESTSTKAEYGA